MIYDLLMALWYNLELSWEEFCYKDRKLGRYFLRGCSAET